MTPRLETELPIQWQTNLMTAEGLDEFGDPYRNYRSQGTPAVIVMDKTGNLFAVSGQDQSLQRSLGELGRTMLGRGILVENVGNKNVWFVSWRTFWPQPKLAVPVVTAAVVVPS
jgi:hypothetical protein